MVSTAQPRRKKRKSVRAGRVVGLYGPRKAGLSTLIRLMRDVSKLRVEEVEPTALAETFAIEGVPARPGAEVVFVELHEPADLEAVAVQGHLDRALDGVLVKVLPEFAVSDETWGTRERAFERLIAQYMLPIACVVHQERDSFAACVGLAQAAGINK